MEVIIIQMLKQTIKSRTNRINLLPTGNTNTLAESTTKSITDGHNISMDFEIKMILQQRYI